MAGKKENNMPYLFLCHGSANVGQLGNDAARELYKEGKLKIACIAAVGAHNPDFIEPFKSDRAVFCVDGCAMRCASKTLEHGDIPVIASMIVTDLGIEKNHDLNLNRRELESVKARILDLIER
jgi:uncharacterized metal-binding protein